MQAILEASSRLLNRRSWELITTGEIARTAGVGIGSLYEYFPGKEAIFARLVELDLEKNEQRLRAHAVSLRFKSAGEKIEGLVCFGVDQFLRGAALKRRLFLNAYRMRKVQDVLRAWNGIADIFADLMRDHLEELRISADRVDLAAYVVSNSIQGLLQVYLLSDAKRCSVEDLKREITEVCQLYLLK